jgi:hypothetical protein
MEPLVYAVKYAEKNIKHLDYIPCFQGGDFLASNRLASFLQEQCPSDITIKDAIIKTNKKIFEHYKSVTVNSVSRVVDFNSSTCEYDDDGEILSIEKLVCYDNGLKYCHLAKEEKDIGSTDPAFFLSSHLYKQFKARSFKGFILIQQNEADIE